MLVVMACDRYFMFHKREYKENNESFKRKTKYLFAVAWFIGILLSIIQISAGSTSQMNQQCPESLNLHESTVFVTIVIILAILIVLSVVAAVILFALVGKKMRNISVKIIFRYNFEL